MAKLVKNESYTLELSRKEKRALEILVRSCSLSMVEKHKAFKDLCKVLYLDSALFDGKAVEHRLIAVINPENDEQLEKFLNS